MTAYTKHFFLDLDQGVESSANVLVPLLAELVQPRSVVDIGCGIGTWLSVFERHGVEDITGVDGPWIDTQLLKIPADRFVVSDLTRPLRLKRQYDLVMSLEVGEHLHSAHAEDYVASLTRLGPVILFSAAVPRQGGVGHINEQWPEYWQALFTRHDYVAIDCVRPRIWNDTRVEWWYAQNMFLYVTRARVGAYAGLASALQETHASLLSLIHPRNYLSKMTWLDDPSHLGVRTVLKAFPALVKNALALRLSRLQYSAQRPESG